MTTFSITTGGLLLLHGVLAWFCTMVWCAMTIYMHFGTAGVHDGRFGVDIAAFLTKQLFLFTLSD